MVGARLGAACTWIANGASAVLTLPSLTLMVMPDVVPIFAVAGVPLSRPVVPLNVAHAGLFAMEYVSGSASASLAEGWNEYAVPTVAVIAGVPEIVGARFGAACTCSAKAGSEALMLPSLTLIVMPEVVLTVDGVPQSRPVVASKLAQVGLLAIENVSGLLSGSLAVGRKEYAVPTVTEVLGVPEIVGAPLGAACA